TLQRRDKTYTDIGLKRDIHSEKPEKVVEEEAAVWEQHRVGSRALYVAALARVRKEELWKKHWSGLTRRAIRETVARISTDPVGVAEMIDAMYGSQSTHAHPGSHF